MSGKKKEGIDTENMLICEKVVKSIRSVPIELFGRKSYNYLHLDGHGLISISV